MVRRAVHGALDAVRALYDNGSLPLLRLPERGDDLPGIRETESNYNNSRIFPDGKPGVPGAPVTADTGAVGPDGKH